MKAMSPVLEFFMVTVFLEKGDNQLNPAVSDFYELWKQWIPSKGKDVPEGALPKTFKENDPYTISFYSRMRASLKQKKL